MELRLEGKVSKVAICENCNGFVLACHIDYVDKEAARQFTKFSNEGFTIRLETVEETRSRKFASYKDCRAGTCKAD